MGQRSTILRKILNSNRAKKGPWKNFPIYFLAIWTFFQAVKGFWPCIFFWPLPWFVAKQLFLACLKDIERKLVVSCMPSRYRVQSSCDFAKIFKSIQRFSKIFKDFLRYSKKFNDIEFKAVVTLQTYSKVFKDFEKCSKSFQDILN